MADLRLGSMVVERQEGTGLPVVTAHGLGGTSASFEALMPALAERTVIRPDLPGAGRSGPRPGLDGIAGLGRAVTEALRGLGIGRALLVGHSMGTLVCQHLAVVAPERVAAMVLYGAISEPPAAARAGLLERAALAKAEGMAGIATAVAAASLSAATRRANPAATAFVRQSLLAQPPEGYAAHARMLAAAVAEDAGAIRCPVWLVTGRDDPVAPPAMAEALAAAISGARAILLPGVGHWPMIEAPGEASKALVEALAAVDEMETGQRARS